MCCAENRTDLMCKQVHVQVEVVAEAETLRRDKRGTSRYP
jgi:hypothetical protein